MCVGGGDGEREKKKWSVAKCESFFFFFFTYFVSCDHASGGNGGMTCLRGLLTMVVVVTMV